MLLDVREDHEWSAGHAVGAVHIPMGELAGRLGELPADPVHVICRSGHRSGQVADWLLTQGRDAVNVAGGMHAWAASGRPVVDDSGAPGVVA